MENKLIPDLEQAQTMIDMLAPNDKGLAFRTFDDDSIKNRKSLVRNHYGTLAQHASSLTTLNQQGASVCITVNQTDGKGAKAENIIGARALFADFDNTRPERLDDLLSLDKVHGVPAPSMVIESSEGKHHAYWIADDIPLDKFSDWQKRLSSFLATTYEGDDLDTTMSDRAKVLRLAGFYHQKVRKAKQGIGGKKGTPALTGVPFMTKVVHTGERYTTEQIEQLINDLPAPQGAKLADSSGQLTQEDNGDDLEQIINNLPLGVAIDQLSHYLHYISGEDYQTWLNIGMALHHETQGDIEGLDLWNDWSQRFTNYQSYDDLATRWQGFSDSKGKPVTAATIIMLAKSNKGYEPFKPTLEQATAIIKQLAELAELDYQMQRKEKAALIGIPLPSLDKVVKQARTELEPNKVAILVEDAEPYAHTVDGDALAMEIYRIIDSHIAGDQSLVTAATLWIFFTWVLEASHIAPIAWINAPEKRCGKSLLLTLLGRMSKRALPTSNITSSALFRSIEKYQPTLFIDEADTFINDNEDLRGVLNSGHSRDNPYIIRCQGEDNEPTPFYVYGAKAIAGIGKIPPTLMDRSISMTLRRKLKHETRQRVRDLPRATTDTIKAKLARWSDDNLKAVADARPELPQSINDRMQDNWEILLKVATVLGGEWPTRALLACTTVSGVENDEPSLNEQLLADIKNILEGMENDKITSKGLIDALCFDSELPWGSMNKGRSITPRQLSQRLSNYGIKSKNIRFADEVAKGYDKADFRDTFKRYLPATL